MINQTDVPILPHSVQRPNFYAPARLALALAGILLLAQGTFEFFMAEQQLHRAVNRQIYMKGPGFTTDSVKYQQFKTSMLSLLQYSSISLAALGLFMLLLTRFGGRFPLCCITVCFALYAGLTLLLAQQITWINNQTTLADELKEGLYWKVPITICLLLAYHFILVRKLSRHA